MNCRRIKELIPLFVEDDLDPRRKTIVSDHLKSCDTCRRLVSEFEESQSWLKLYVPREIDAAYFEGIGKEVWAAIANNIKQSMRERITRRLWSVPIPIAVAAALLIVAGIALVMLRPGADGAGTNDRTVAVSPSSKVDGPPTATTVHNSSAEPRDQLDKKRAALGRKRSDKNPGKVKPEAPELLRVADAAVPSAPGVQEVAGVVENADLLRIYIQTSDPNIRIIWIVPKQDDGD